MAKASDNPFPSILLVEQAAKPATPGAGTARLYRGTDDKLNMVDETGSVTQVGGSASRKGDPDARPASPSAYDDEFEAALSGWTTLGAPSVMNADSTVPGHLYIKPTIATGDNAVGAYKAPPAVPFTVTAKLGDAMHAANYNRAALFIGAATPGSMKSLFIGYGGTATTPFLAVGTGTGPTAATSNSASISVGNTYPIYLRIKVNSATSVTYQFSFNGQIWRDVITNENPSFTIGSVGLWAQSHNATLGGEAAFDWIRFT